MRRRLPIAVAVQLTCAALAGCGASGPVNPSFAVTGEQSRAAWKQMQADPKPLRRPVIVLCGIYDPGFASHHIANEIRDVVADRSEVIFIEFFTNGSFDECAHKVIQTVEKHFPSSTADETVEIDVIGYSMGGLVARVAAIPPPRMERDAESKNSARSRKRLKIARLFTIATPHRGAKLAGLPTFDRRVLDMRANSIFLEWLNCQPRDYEIFAYARLDDAVVGEANCAPPGMHVWWLAKSDLLSHVGAFHDGRILADIAQRLRGEAGFATAPPTPLPNDRSAASEP